MLKLFIFQDICQIAIIQYVPYVFQKALLTKSNTFMCPKDNFIYSNVNNIDYFKINKNILEIIKQSENNQTINDSTKLDII